MSAALTAWSSLSRSPADGDHHLLTAFGLDLDHHRVVAPRGCGPAHAPDVVAAHVVTQPRKRRRRSGRLRASKARHRAQAASESELDALDGDDVWKHRDLALKLQSQLPPPPPVSAPDLEVDRAEPVGAAARR